MNKKFFAKCQECSFEGENDNECCPLCGSYIYADISSYEHSTLKDEVNELRKELEALKQPPSSQIIKLDLGFTHLVVEVYNSNHPVPEIVIGLEHPDDTQFQDIAVIRQAIDGDKKLSAVECLVYTDEFSQDYTHKFNINQYKENQSNANNNDL